MIGIPVRFCFHGELNDFLPREKRRAEFGHAAGTTDTLKHVLESLGVPHTEIGSVEVNGGRASLSDRFTENCVVDVFPHTMPVLLDEPRFVIDGHLGRLAAYLRMLGFDTRYERLAEDSMLAAVASGEDRFLLTRDVGLLKRKEVEKGYCVRADKPLDQLREVTCRFALHSRLVPFSRCMECNGLLDSVSKEEVAGLLPPHTRETKNEFSRCRDCGKIFWRGSHHARMMGWIGELVRC